MELLFYMGSLTSGLQTAAIACKVGKDQGPSYRAQGRAKECMNTRHYKQRREILRAEAAERQKLQLKENESHEATSSQHIAIGLYPHSPTGARITKASCDSMIHLGRLREDT